MGPIDVGVVVTVDVGARGVVTVCVVTVVAMLVAFDEMVLATDDIWVVRTVVTVGVTGIGAVVIFRGLVVNKIAPLDGPRPACRFLAATRTE